MKKGFFIKKSTKLIIFLMVVIIFFTVIAIYFSKNVKPIVLDYSQATVRALGVNAVNQAAIIVINDELKYEDLFTIEFDNNNKVSMIKANSPAINVLARNMASVTQNNLKSIGVQELGIPLGTFTGINLLTGHGPDITIKIMPVGNVLCDFKSQFIQAGINQTVHKIYIDVLIDISIILPIDDVNVSVNTEILVCENLIIGEIPDVFLNMGDKIFDLVPTR